MYYCIRLKKGEDLKETIENYSIRKQVSGVVLCCVGCLTNLNIRLADGKSTLEKAGQFEIVSMTGTLSKDGVHIHISVSDEFGNTIGGHLKNGCIVNTTAEICILLLDNYEFKREFDQKTGYDELIIN